jgi:hypothetical protein
MLQRHIAQPAETVGMGGAYGCDVLILRRYNLFREVDGLDDQAHPLGVRHDHFVSQLRQPAILKLKDGAIRDQLENCSIKSGNGWHLDFRCLAKQQIP